MKQLFTLLLLASLSPAHALEPTGQDRPAHLQRHKLTAPVLAPRADDPSLFDSGKVECPMVIRRGNEWWMYYTAIRMVDGVVHSTIGRAVSDDLVHWRDRTQVLTRGSDGAFDHGGVSGPFVFTIPSDLAAATQPSAEAIRRSLSSNASHQVDPGGTTDERVADRPCDRLYMIYIGFPRVGYESRPGRHGLAWSDDGVNWTRSPANPIRDVGEKGTWDDGCLYKVFVLPYDGAFWMFYNAYGTADRCEQIGLATADRLEGPWKRHPANPLLRKSTGDPQRDRDHVIIGDPWITRHGDEWEMYYFAFDGRHARECLATSGDLVHWTKSPHNPIMDVGPADAYDGIHCHKPCIVVKDGVCYHFFTACGPNDKGGEHRAIGLATSTRVDGPEYRE